MTWRMTGSAPSDGRLTEVAERYSLQQGEGGLAGEGGVRGSEWAVTWRMTGSAPSDGRWGTIAERLQGEGGSGGRGKGSGSRGVGDLADDGKCPSGAGRCGIDCFSERTLGGVPGGEWREVGRRAEPWRISGKWRFCSRGVDFLGPPGELF